MFKQGYMLVVVSLLTAQILVFIGIGLEILALYGPLSLLVVIGILAAFFLTLAGIVGLPYLIAMVALWPTKIPKDYQPPALRGATAVPANDASSTEVTPLLHARWLFPWTIPRMIAYAGFVTAILVLGFLVFRHSRLGTIPNIQIYLTFCAEAAFFAALFAYVLINRRRAASRST